MPKIFVSYRRSDAPGHAGRIYDGLAERFGAANVFKDVESLEPGADFGELIEETVGRCDFLIAVIGRSWLGDAAGGPRRLDDNDDWVRIEIATALERQIRVVPVLVDGASMPTAGDLPEALQRLARRHAHTLVETAWRPTLQLLLDQLEEFERRAAQAASPTPPTAVDGGGARVDGDEFRVLAARFFDAPIDVREATAGAVKRLAASLPLDLLLRFAASSSDGERVGAAIGLGVHLQSSPALGQDPRLRTDLTRLLQDKRSRVRYRAVEAIQESPQLLQALQPLLAQAAVRDPNDVVRERAAQALTGAGL